MSLSISLYVCLSLSVIFSTLGSLSSLVSVCTCTYTHMYHRLLSQCLSISSLSLHIFCLFLARLSLSRSSVFLFPHPLSSLTICLQWGFRGKLAIEQLGFDLPSSVHNVLILQARAEGTQGKAGEVQERICKAQALESSLSLTGASLQNIFLFLTSVVVHYHRPQNRYMPEKIVWGNLFGHILPKGRRR